MVGPPHENRYKTHYDQTLSEDLMYMSYDHRLALDPPPRPSLKLERDLTLLNPYELNRPPPMPRGNRPTKPSTILTTPGTVPELEAIVLHCMVKEAGSNKHALLSAMMALRAISGQTYQGGGQEANQGVDVVRTKRASSSFRHRRGVPIGVRVTIRGPQMYTFVQSLVDFVLPRIREFPGVTMPYLSSNKNSISALSGVVSFGLKRDAMGLFPQVETNVDSYPNLQGFHIHFITNVKGKHAQAKSMALLSGMRIPITRK